MKLKIRELREEKNITQNDLAKKINTTNKNIWAYENGKAEPSIDSLKRLADFFDVSIDYLVGREDDFGHVAVSSVPLSAKEQKILATFKKLSDLEQDKLIADAEFYASRSNTSLKKQG